MTNTEICGYDGGDCCLDPVLTDYCQECICHYPITSNVTTDIVFTTPVIAETTTTMASVTLTCEEVMGTSGWIGDGMCDDTNNNVPCSFDGGDCCLEVVITDYCIDCLCLTDSSSTESSGVTTGTSEAPPTGNSN